MINRLESNQVERVEEKYRDHPLFRACNDAFEDYQARMRYLMFSPTEVFMESVEVIDIILEDGTDKMEYIRNLWRKLIIRYKLWPLVHQGNIDDKEYETAVCSVFYTVAVVLSRHQDSYYNEQIKDALLAEIYSHTSIVKQEEDEVIISLSKYADELEQWMDEYADSAIYLSDDIDDVAHGRKPCTKLKVAISKSKGNGDKRTKNPQSDYSRYSFILTLSGRFKNKERNALEWLHDELKNKNLIEDIKDIVIDEKLSHLLNIEEKNKLAFNAVFSGADTDCHIVWTATTKELGYFINQLEERGVLSWKSGPRKWQVTRNRIWLRKKEQIINETTRERHYTYKYEPFKEDAFNGSLVPADTTKLDVILDMIAPPISNNKIGDEVNQSFRGYEDFEENKENDRGKKLSNGYRDRSHRARE